VKFHFTPTRASWLNQVEIWFSILRAKVVTRMLPSPFSSVQQLLEHIDAFIKLELNKPTIRTTHPSSGPKARVHQRRFKGRRISQL